MLPRGSVNICVVVLIVLHQSVSALSRLGVCNYDDDDLYDTCRQLEVGVIEVPLGVNVIPKGTALESFCSSCACSWALRGCWALCSAVHGVTVLPTPHTVVST